LGELELEDAPRRLLAEDDRVLLDARGARARRPAALLEDLGVGREVAEAVLSLEVVEGEARLRSAAAREVEHEGSEERRLPGADDAEDPDLHATPSPAGVACGPPMSS